MKPTQRTGSLAEAWRLYHGGPAAFSGHRQGRKTLLPLYVKRRCTAEQVHGTWSSVSLILGSVWACCSTYCICLTATV